MNASLLTLTNKVLGRQLIGEQDEAAQEDKHGLHVAHNIGPGQEMQPTKAANHTNWIARLSNAQKKCDT